MQKVDPLHFVGSLIPNPTDTIFADLMVQHMDRPVAVMLTAAATWWVAERLYKRL